MAHIVARRYFQIMLLCLLISSRGQAGNIPVVNPTSPGGDTTTPTITQPSPPSSTFPGPVTNPNPPTGGYPPLDGTTPTGGGYPPLDGTTPTGGGGYPPFDAKANASPTSLQVALDYACGYGGADCGQIQQGASCYEPNTIRDHASFAFNSYYQKHPGSDSCNFGGAAQLTSTDPSKGSCRFSASSGTVSTSPPSQPSPPDFNSPPSTSTFPPPITTPTTGMPGSGPPFGVAEPTGLPSSATHASHSFISFFTAVGILLLRQYYL
ncbi:hypothetical protein Bca52824_037574 [Brassica carinata]|uniref:X8 domain-containing protein n=1 Tax=Brassica carinata TaxID=52824 RepID=A0A8X7RQD9_BRACI|nr:hypothetical protein Bca52824_037574 [Brassica carinata]